MKRLMIILSIPFAVVCWLLVLLTPITGRGRARQVWRASLSYACTVSVPTYCCWATALLPAQWMTITALVGLMLVFLRTIRWWSSIYE